MDWSEFWIEHAGLRDTAEKFGPAFLPELKRVIEMYAPEARSFLEWGSGLSTLLLARVATDRGGRLTTLDHDPDYARSVVARLPLDAPVRSLTADLMGPKLSQADTGLNYSMLPLELGEIFDFILVDGRRRVECMVTAFVLAQPATVVVLHDYRRARYQVASFLFETVETGEQFWVMRPRPMLLQLTAAERTKVLQDLHATALASQ